MNRLFGLTLALVIFTPGRARAECEEAVTTEEVLEWVGQIEEGLRGDDLATSSRVALAAEKGLPCLVEPLAIPIVARAYRALGTGLYVGGSTERGKKWLLTAAELDSMFEFGMGELPEGHELGDVWLDQVDATGESRTTVPGRQLVDAEVFLDGKLLKLPMAHPNRMHLIQVRSGADLKGWVFEGTDFPEEIFSTGDEQASGGKSKEKSGGKKDRGDKGEKSAKPAKSKPVKVTPLVSNWPAERIALIVTGSASVVGSGVLYGMSAGARGRAIGAKTRTDLDDAVKANRSLFVASGAVAAVGAGSLTFGALFFVIDGQPVTGFNIRF
jgi:hypothetical protein